VQGLLVHDDGVVLLIVENHPAHRAGAVKDVVERNARRCTSQG